MFQRIKEAWTRRKDKANKRKIRAIESIAFIVCFAMLLTTATYAWVRRKWTPVISQDNMQIMSGDSLVFALIGSEQEATVQGATMLSDLVNLTNFVFRPVSNISGTSEDFFTLNTVEYQNEYFEHLLPGGTVTAASYTQQGLNNGYIEFSIKITGRDAVALETMNDYTKYVYFSAEDTYLKTDEGLSDGCSLAFRVSITMNGARTLIFSNRGTGSTHKAITNAKSEDGSVWLADGARYRSASSDPRDFEYDYIGNEKATRFIPEGGTEMIDLVQSTTNVNAFADFTGPEPGEAFTDNNTLFHIGPGESQTITIRIWLEGEDPACIGDIMGEFVNLRIGFKSYNVTDPGGILPPDEPPEEPDDVG